MNYLGKVRSKYILKQIVKHLNKKILLSIINYNKNFQDKLDINKEDYKKLSFTTEIDLNLSVKNMVILLKSELAKNLILKYILVIIKMK